MAIFEEKAYGVQCDVCGKVYMNEYSGFTLWTMKTHQRKRRRTTTG